MSVHGHRGTSWNTSIENSDPPVLIQDSVEPWRSNHGVEVIGPRPHGGCTGAGHGMRLCRTDIPPEDTPMTSFGPKGARYAGKVEHFSTTDYAGWPRTFRSVPGTMGAVEVGSLSLENTLVTSSHGGAPARELDRPRFVELWCNEDFMIFSGHAMTEEAANGRSDHMLAMCEVVPFAKQPIV